MGQARAVEHRRRRPKVAKLTDETLRRAAEALWARGAEPDVFVVPPRGYWIPASANLALMTPGARWVVEDIEYRRRPFKWWNPYTWPKVLFWHWWPPRTLGHLHLDWPTDIYVKARLA